MQPDIVLENPENPRVRFMPIKTPENPSIRVKTQKMP